MLSQACGERIHCLHSGNIICPHSLTRDMVDSYLVLVRPASTVLVAVEDQVVDVNIGFYM